MEDSANVSQEPLFRANKRRKIFRKRDVANEEEGQTANARPESSSLEAYKDEKDAAIALPTIIKPAAKRRGLGFSSAGQQRTSNGNTNTEMALVPMPEEQEEQEGIPTDRFVRPTGKVGVVEDKHLTAYVDMKLAERRQSALTPTPSEPYDGNGLIGRPLTPSKVSSTTPNRIGEPSQGNPLSGNQRPPATAASSATSLPTQQQQQQDGKSQKPRRKHLVRDPDAIARDSLVDEILRESQQGPIYSQPPSNTSTTIRGVALPSGNNIDNDAAVAQAFKTEFLADLDARSRRRAQNPPTSSSSRNAASTAQPSGPKLGGSRSQREKMRAAEEAKGAAGKRK